MEERDYDAHPIVRHKITEIGMHIVRRCEQSMLVLEVNAAVANRAWAQGLALFAAQQGWPVTPGMAVICSAGLVALAIAACLVITGVLLIAAVMGVVMACAIYRLPQRAYDRQEELVAKQMIEAFRSSTVALRAGKSLVQAISYVAERVDNPLKEVFLQATFEYFMGRGQRASVRFLQNHLNAPGARLFGSALQIALLTGSGVEQVFERASITLEKAQRQKRELSAKTAQARLSAQVVGIMPLFLVVVLCLLSADFREGVNSAAGSISLVMAAGLDVLGLAVIQRIMQRALPTKEDW